MIVVNFLGNNCYNLSTAEPDYVKLFLLACTAEDIFVKFNTKNQAKVLDIILQMKYNP